MSSLSESLEERYSEIEAYLDLVEGFETAIQSGIPRIGDDGPAVSVEQQKILNSSVYLQIYNLIEATVTNCLDEVSKSTMRRMVCLPGDLNEPLKREWVRSTARTHSAAAPDTRLNDATAMCDHLTASLPVGEFRIEKGGGGNWDDKAIERITARIGCRLSISRRVKRGVKKKIRDDLGSMELVVSLRNKLAHGNISFVECGQYDTASELRDLALRVVSYLRELVSTIDSYIDEHQYLRADARPDPQDAAQAP